ncbi:SAM hydrolase/SAM-dependent halogenase family protein [Alkalicoccobacillus murimartini]|uniref:S-adenosylmethionine hydrolase n=1 Tax=Alkalicoccobacillus murimartini TaxID=171685 RepID=A0ABT9YIJ1_9BACI|nr:S-adenosyl-l-methionine hydroxide adenosyltransferase family protein [Alkalicoccobacillus murimartini]MDQ0207680.1 S-adenosylmethionine hydrolase [Alkalicoccobacillus murimartini]
MNRMLVLQSDFGLSDGAVSAMYGVALSVNPDLKVSNLTHDIPPYNVWEASYRLLQTISYWPEGTVFVSVVDPGVGSKRKSLIAKLNSNHLIITPDNGTLTHLSRLIGLKEVRELDEVRNRLPHSGESYTFHGRDIYAYTGARLASGEITFEEVGESLDPDLITQLPIQEARVEEQQALGSIDILDVRFGNIWTNIHRSLFTQLGIQYGDIIDVAIEDGTRQVYKNTMTFGRSFADTSVGKTVLYVNSIDHMAIGINQGSFAKAYEIGTGHNWKIAIVPTFGK